MRCNQCSKRHWQTIRKFYFGGIGWWWFCSWIFRLIFGRSPGPQRSQLRPFKQNTLSRLSFDYPFSILSVSLLIGTHGCFRSGVSVDPLGDRTARKLFGSFLLNGQIRFTKSLRFFLFFLFQKLFTHLLIRSTLRKKVCCRRFFSLWIPLACEFSDFESLSSAAAQRWSQPASIIKLNRLISRSHCSGLSRSRIVSWKALRKAAASTHNFGMHTIRIASELRERERVASFSVSLSLFCNAVQPMKKALPMKWP